MTVSSADVERAIEIDRRHARKDVAADVRCQVIRPTNLTVRGERIENSCGICDVHVSVRIDSGSLACDRTVATITDVEVPALGAVRIDCVERGLMPRVNRAVGCNCR